jgi:hypothetical protein
MPSQSVRTVAEPESDPEAGTPKKVSLRRAFKSFTRFSFHIRGDGGAARVKLKVSYSGSKEIAVPDSVSLQDAFGVKAELADEPMIPSLLIDRGGSPPTPIDPPPQPPPRPPANRALRGLGRVNKA